MQTDTHKLTFQTLADSLRYYNYAALRASGFNFVLDMMRYDTAFFCRAADVEHLCAAVEGGRLDWLRNQFSIVLGKFDWKGHTKAHWTHERLLSTMEYDPIADPVKLFDLNSDFNDWIATPPNKIKTTITVIGVPSYILRVMHLNRAFPDTETDAQTLEQGFYSPQNETTVVLGTFVSKEAEWRLP